MGKTGVDIPTVHGVLIGESLKLGAVLDGIALTVKKISRVEIGDADVPVWTFIEFEAPADQAGQVADGLSRALDGQLGWYCDFRSADETFVVFADRVFRYPRGDTKRRAEAIDYGRLVGVPDEQLDWAE